MGGTTEHLAWDIRVTTNDEVDWTKYDWSPSKRTPREIAWLMSVVETGKTSQNRHYHIALIYNKPITYNQRETVMDKIRKKVTTTVDPNSSVYMKPWNGEEYKLRYNCKEDDNPVYYGDSTVLPYTIKTVKEYRDQWLLEKSALKQIVFRDVIVEVTNMVKDSDEYSPAMSIEDLQVLIVDKYIKYHDKHNASKYKQKYHCKTELFNIMARIQSTKSQRFVQQELMRLWH